MPQRNLSNKEHNTRKRAHSKTRGQGHVPAAPDAAPTLKQAQAELSRTHDGNLPLKADNHINADAETVSSEQQEVTSEMNPIPKNLCVHERQANLNQSFNENGKNSGPPGHIVFSKVSDNREASIQTDLPPEDPLALIQAGSMMALTSELKAIHTRIDSLDKIELSISTLVTQMGGLVEPMGRWSRRWTRTPPQYQQLTQK